MLELDRDVVGRQARQVGAQHISVLRLGEVHRRDPARTRDGAAPVGVSKRFVNSRFMVTGSQRTSAMGGLL